jgi:hypothetical protein
MAFQLAGQTLKKGSSFSAGGTMFPSNWLELSTPEERKNIGISETADTPTAEDAQEPIRLAGGGAPTSSADNADTSLEPSKPESGPGSDAEWNTFLEALGAGFDGSEPKEIAGNRFTVSETGLTYNKPSRGSALSYGLNRVEKPVEAPIKTDLLPAAPSKPAAATPPAGSSTGVTYQQPETYKQEESNLNFDIPSSDDKDEEEKKPVTDEKNKIPPDTGKTKTETPTTAPETKPAKTPETLAMSRFVDPTTGRHLYTSNIGEENSAGLSSEGQAFQLFKDSGQATGTSDVYRLFNPTTGDHFYTASAAEKDVAAGAGYNLEKVVGAAYTTPSDNSTAVNRYFQALTGQHFYTSDPEEEKNLGSHGFQKEGVAFYTPKPQTAASVMQPNQNSSASSEPEPMRFANPMQTQEFRSAPEPSPAQESRTPISANYGIDANYFGGEDLKAARAAGYSDSEIKDYISANMSQLRDINKPGGGGIYDQLFG